LKKKLLLLGIAAVLLVVVVSGVSFLFLSYKDKILPGVRVEWIDVGGLTKEEARKKIELSQQEFLSAPVELVAGENKLETTRAELGFSMDAEKVVDKCYLLGKSGSLFKRIDQFWDAYLHQIEVPYQEVKVDYSKAEKILEPLTKNIGDKPQNARLVIDDRDKISIIPGKPGLTADLESSFKELLSFNKPFTATVELQFREQEPEVTTEDVQAMGINGLLASYSTSFDASNINRSHNIALASKALNGSLVKPGEVFSFNGRVGPRTAKRGYREAIIIEANQFVPGLGGGVCQVSTTLYNAVLLAGLEIVERSNHSLAIAYAPLGRDAAVSYGYQDLKFRNNMDSYIYIKTHVGRGVLTMKIFGNTKQKKKVQLQTSINSVIQPKVITKKDSNLLEGKTVVENSGAKGYRVSAYRIIDGTKHLLSNDYYRPINRVVRVGTKPAPEPDPPKGNGDDEPQEPGQPQEPEEPVGDDNGGNGDNGDNNGDNGAKGDNGDNRENDDPTG
jgi:vancomycin resistance protein YoaR